MLRNKRGVFFTTIVIIILALFYMSFTFYPKTEERKNVRERIITMNNFVFSIEEDMSRQIYISGHRAILSIESYILDQGNYIPDAEGALNEALINGTIYSQNMSLMEGYKLEVWKKRVTDLGDKLNLEVNYTILNVTIEQDNPWDVKISTTINISIEDKGKLASWKKVSIIISRVKVEGFEDPLYLINSNGLISNVIKKTKYSAFVSGSDISNLSAHTTNSYYIASSSAPSFIDRLEGKLTSNQQGIESLIDVAQFSGQGVSPKDKSVVDYIYFSTNNPSSCTVTPPGMPSWFKLDDSHLSTYQVSWVAGC